ncbi:15569_t:CDS:2 [Acaulospora colombiana]|uniref:15569_t:CDS:1 n=1 Tax=Acaulospora colombiana TaxID=27376 RepID=A0ACA9KIT6_9GLOM|nr:15569_t:CDS:2 [Acaulospora colombiana]
MGNSLNKSSQKPVNNYHELRPQIDDNEKDRRHLAHNIVREMFGGNFSAPVEDILQTRNAQVLEVGCGPGTWVLEMSSDYRGNTFIGLDMLSLAPETKPFCVQFVIGDILKGGPETMRVFNSLINTLRPKGVNPSIVLRVPEFMQNMNLEDIQTVKRVFPGNPGVED